MSATITKFVLRPTQADGVKAYTRDVSVQVERPAQASTLNKLQVNNSDDQSNCIYLVELASGELYHCSEPSAQADDLDETLSPAEKIKYISNFFRTTLGVPNIFFEDHVARGPKFTFSEDFQTPRPPTSLRTDTSFLLRYYELVSYSGEPSHLTMFTKRDDACLSCAATGRQIQCHQWHGSRTKDGLLLIVPRKCSYWQQKGKRGCNTVIICDPKISTAQVRGHGDPISVEPHDPFNGGYSDFAAFSELACRSDGTSLEHQPPPRTSFSDDFTHYLEAYGSHQDGVEPQLSVSLLIKKLVAAHYAPLIGFVTFQISSMRTRGWALKRTTKTERDAADMVETDWSRFRCTEYLEDMEANLDALGIRRFDCNVYAKIDCWQAWQVEFHWIYQQLIQRRADYDRLTTSMAALAGIIGTRQNLEEAMRALKEAKGMKTLTVIAMAFAPLAWTSGLFNMTDEFIPGGPKFWVYVIVALSATVIVFVITLLAQRGYNDRAEWSVETFFQSLRRSSKKKTKKETDSAISSDEKSIAGSLVE